jgi:hypothetical protein
MGRSSGTAGTLRPAMPLSTRASDATTRNGAFAPEDVAQVAERSGLRLAEVIEMPANNFTLIFAPAVAHA